MILGALRFPPNKAKREEEANVWALTGWRWGGSLVRSGAPVTPILETGDRLVDVNWTNEANFA